MRTRRANDRAIAKTDPNSPDARGWSGDAANGRRVYRGLTLAVRLTERAWWAGVASDKGSLCEKRSIATRLKAERWCLRKAQGLLGEETPHPDSKPQDHAKEAKEP